MLSRVASRKSPFAWEIHLPLVGWFTPSALPHASKSWASRVISPFTFIRGWYTQRLTFTLSLKRESTIDVKNDITEINKKPNNIYLSQFIVRVYKKSALTILILPIICRVRVFALQALIIKNQIICEVSWHLIQKYLTLCSGKKGWPKDACTH